MSSFVVDLWESIFTPGPTPTILRATNVSFAALQIVLLGLLFATYSVHFVVLSVLCAGLWWAINWFAAEVATIQREQKEKDEQDKRQGASRDGTPATTAAAADDSSDTEVEGSAKTTATARGERDVRSRQKGQQQQQQQSSVGSMSPSGTQSSVSTEDEWEKVSEGEKDKSA